ncbi:MAG: hypothetical protein OHK0022_20180 [Roseiflexaceae bacterium]
MRAAARLAQNLHRRPQTIHLPVWMRKQPRTPSAAQTHVRRNITEGAPLP